MTGWISVSENFRIRGYPKVVWRSYAHWYLISVRWIWRFESMWRYSAHDWFQFKGEKILFTTTFSQFISPGWPQRLPTAQIRFFTWLKALSTALAFKGIQTLLANQMSKKVAALLQRFSIYVLAVGYFSWGRASISSLKPCLDLFLARFKKDVFSLSPDRTRAKLTST